MILKRRLSTPKLHNFCWAGIIRKISILYYLTLSNSFPNIKLLILDNRYEFDYNLSIFKLIEIIRIPCKYDCTIFPTRLHKIHPLAMSPNSGIHRGLFLWILILSNCHCGRTPCREQEVIAGASGF